MEYTENNGHNNGLLYEGSPQKVPSRELFESARGAGKPVMKAKQISVYESPSPHSKLISHSSSALPQLTELAKAQDIDGLIQKLDKPNLSPLESVVKLLTDEIQKGKSEVKLLADEIQNGIDGLIQKLDKPNLSPLESVVKLLTDEIQNGKHLLQILKIGTSPLILSFECLKQVESGISPVYKQHISNLEHTVLKAFGKVIKTFQRNQPDPFTIKSTGEDHKVCAKVDIGTFGAALYHFVKHYGQYEQGNLPYKKEIAKALATPLLQVYCQIMKQYVLSLPNATSGMVDVAGDPISLKEWYAFYKRRMQRDHKGGHCAAWRDGYSDEAARLMHVKDLFAEMVNAKMPELDEFPVLKQLVVPHMDMYIAKKQAQHSKKRAAEDMSSDESDAILREWSSS